MIFTEIRFVLLVAACWLMFFAVPVRFRPHVLAFWGVVFYGLYAGNFLVLVTTLVVVTYLLSAGGRLWPSLVLLGGVLAYYKIRGSGPGLSGIVGPGAAGAAAGASDASVVVPLGLSFLTFELMHFAIERRRGREVGDVSLTSLGAFAFFFPCRMAGPIKRFPEFVEALQGAEASAEHLYAGSVRIMVGLFKKFALADFFGTKLAELPYATTTRDAWAVMLAYSLYIFFDFSAYSDIAIGVARVMGITIPENFMAPYLSRNIQDFWNRWHISLSSWLRDYVFMEMGRRLFRKPVLRTRPKVIAVLSYMTTFIVCGAWHGLASNFLLWGAYHGALLSGHQLFRGWLPASVARSAAYRSSIAAAAGVGLTFGLVTVGWVLFAMDLRQGLHILRLMFHLPG